VALCAAMCCAVTIARAADSAVDQWLALAGAWASSSGAAHCSTTVAVQDGDLASDRNAAPCVIAWDGADHAFALEQNGLAVAATPSRLRGLRKECDAAVDRAMSGDPALAWRQGIPESPWPQLGMALRGAGADWWKSIDPDLGEVAVKSFSKKDDGSTIVMLAGANGSLELTFVGDAPPVLRAATRRIESGPRVPKGAALEWRMTFDAVAIPAGLLSLEVGDRRRVERLDDLQPRKAPSPSRDGESAAPRKPDDAAAPPKPLEPSTIPTP
jgi:hypothetical protein